MKVFSMSCSLKCSYASSVMQFFRAGTRSQTIFQTRRTISLVLSSTLSPSDAPSKRFLMAALYLWGG